MAAVSFDLSLSALMPVLFGVTLTRFAVMGHYALHRKIYLDFKAFVLAEFCAAIGMGALYLRSAYGENPFVVFLTTLGPLSHPVIIFYGLGTYARVPRLRERTIQNLWIVGLACIAQMADLLLAPDITRRVLVFTAVSVVLCLRIAIELPLLNRRGQTGFKLLAATFLGSAAFHAARGWNLMNAQHYDYATMMQADSLLAFFVFYRILQSVLELYVVFDLNSQMLESDLRLATAQIEHMAQTDVLTGALNRRGLEILGAEAVRSSHSMRQPASVIMLDLDWFKQVNDTLGHVAGDELLRGVAALCQDSLRGDDVFARYGGEEFVVVAPFTDAKEARLLAERMRQGVEDTRFPATQGRAVSASFGVASGRRGSLEQLLKQADGALYAAKQGGRNQVVLALGPVAAPGAGARA